MAPSVVTDPEMGKVVGETTQARMVLCRLKRAAWGQVPAGVRNLRNDYERPAEVTAEPASPLEGEGFEPVWGFSCQVVVFCSEQESRSSSRRLRSGSRSARKGSRDRNASKA